MLPDRLDKGIHYLQDLGYRVKTGKHIADRNGYLAGKDQVRSDDLNQMLADDRIDAIFCARGGYGTPRILSAIDYDVVEKNPKIVVGYSDITALQLAIYAQCKVVTFSGPMAAVEMGKPIDPFTERYFWDMLSGSAKGLRLSGQNGKLEHFGGGTAQGVLLGGNLSLICTLVGTPYLPDFTDAILLLEDVGEEPYKIDRKLMQLKLSGILHRVGGIVLGDFESCVPIDDVPSLTINQIIRDLTSDLNIPIVAGLPYGHIDVKYTLPIGARASLNADDGYIEILDAPVV